LLRDLIATVIASQHEVIHQQRLEEQHYYNIIATKSLDA